GKAFEYRVVYPGGETRTLLKVPNYRATWQLWYDLSEPIALPKGAKIECTAHFDNSPNNPLNPDPSKRCCLGRSKLGRNDGRLLQCRIRCQDAVEGPVLSHSETDRSGRHLKLENS